MKKIYNFYAGPAVLPKAIQPACIQAIQDFNGTGMSLLEISHRSKDFIAVMDEATALVREMLGVPAGYQVLFLQGGASLQFYMVPLNLLDEKASAAYLETGAWAKKAIKEAKLCGKVNVVGSSADKNYSYLPTGYEVPKDSSYLHFTSNNTIFGTQLREFPKVEVPLVADMSSDILSHTFDVSKFGLIYAGAQKNIGPAGVTLVVVREDMLGKVTRTIPSMLDYRIHIKDQSMFNTPPCFPVFVVRETLKWLKSIGGVAAIQKQNEAKALKLYAEIDANPLFSGTCAPEARSYMNVCFVMKDATLEEEFLGITKTRGLIGLKGHRSVGGFRASIYNAMEPEGVDLLVETMREFAKSKG